MSFAHVFSHIALQEKSSFLFLPSVLILTNFDLKTKLGFSFGKSFQRELDQITNF